MIIGLTGSIAMGKSTAGEMFRELGYPVFDADNAVHQLYKTGGKASKTIADKLPEVMSEGAVDRAALAKKIMEDPSLLQTIEKIVHPLVRELENDFIDLQAKTNSRFAILDIPLLFESNRVDDVDVIIVVSTSSPIQRQRAMKRPGMTLEKLNMIIERQVPNDQKRAQADYVIDTSGSFDDTFIQVKKIASLLELKNKSVEG